VAVLDTGIVAGHPELTAKVLPGYDFVHESGYANDGDGRDADPSDPGDWVSQADKTNDPGRYSIPGAECAVENSSWHGTNIAGLIVATTNDGRGTAGINWDGRILPVRVAGKCGADPRDIVDGMRWAAGLPACRVYDEDTGVCTTWAPANPNPVKIINVSFGGTGNCTKYQDTIDLLATMNVVIVAAAGNEQGSVTRPAKCPGVVGVGAVNRDGFKANYSNFGPELTITTVGGDSKVLGNNGQWSALLGDEGLLGLDIAGITSVGTIEGGVTPNPYGYATLFGTSFSAPLVAGAVSLMLSANPNLTHTQIVNGLRLTARPHVMSTMMPICSAAAYGRCLCTTTTCGAGLLDADQAVRYAQSLFAGGVYTAPNWPNVNIDSPELTAALALGADEPDADAVGGGGGGALQPAWLLALALLTLLLACAPRARHAVRRARR
jgi:serine protease